MKYIFVNTGLTLREKNQSSFVQTVLKIFILALQGNIQFRFYAHCY